MAEKIRLAIKERRSEGASDIEILEEVISALKDESPKKELSKEGKTSKNQISRKEISEEDLKCKITDIMIEIGVPANILGYKYLRDAILYTFKDDKAVYSITKELYPEIAIMHSTTSSKVERAIRHAIEVAWGRGDVNALNKYFGYTTDIDKGKATNSQFIAMIADHLKLKYKLS